MKDGETQEKPQSHHTASNFPLCTQSLKVPDRSLIIWSDHRKQHCVRNGTNKYSRLPLSRIPRDSLKHFEISVPRHISVVEVRKKINWTTTFNKWICNLTPEVRDILKILWKRGEIAPQEQFLLFSTIFCYLFLDCHIKTGTRISLRYKQ